MVFCYVTFTHAHQVSHGVLVSGCIHVFVHVCLCMCVRGCVSVHVCARVLMNSGDYLGDALRV